MEKYILAMNIGRKAKGKKRKRNKKKKFIKKIISVVAQYFDPIKFCYKLSK